MHINFDTLCKNYALSFLSWSYNIPSYYGQTLQWRHNERDDVFNHRRLNSLLNLLFRLKKTSKLRVTVLC